MTIEIMPPRPIGVSPRFYRRMLPRLLLLGVLAALCFALAAYAASDAATIHVDQQIWRNGEEGWASVRGRSSPKTPVGWLVRSYELTVSYRDANGDLYEGEQRFTTLFARRVDKRPADLRYDPEQPERFTVSWAIEARGGRWRAMLGETAVFSLLGLLALLGFRFVRRTIINVRRAAHASDELLVEFTGVHEGRYRFRVPERYFTQIEFAHLDGRSFEDIGHTEALPLLGYHKGQEGVALCPLWGEPVLVHSDFYPFAVTDEQARLVGHRIVKRHEHVD